ncbi:hypothetical protein MOMUL_22290 [Moorella mulderi DSM 14980]|uniref:Uncharacterized protein n=1 Tax=Moorella mulderi DSM 14980 TaxID=1122241 RepID=A0A151AVB4_9FIRM|nr:hypothetical protein MOMUL_22290 [Moorella mulderi DSM 14980]
MILLILIRRLPCPSNNIFAVKELLGTKDEHFNFGFFRLLHRNHFYILKCRFHTGMQMHARMKEIIFKFRCNLSKNITTINIHNNTRNHF